MERAALKEFTYGGLMELMKNRRYYYHSTIGANYSHWTDEGKDAVLEYMNMVGHKMIEAEEAELNQRSKDMVIKGLKGEVK